jgi:hypothetical protein
MNSPNLDSLKQLADRCDVLLEESSFDLDKYWNKDLAGFHANHDSINQGRVNVTTTCFCMSALLQQSQLMSRFFNTVAKPPGADFPRVVETLLSTPWNSEQLGEYNIYTTPIVLSTLHSVIESQLHKDEIASLLAKKVHRDKIKIGITAILNNTDTGSVAFGEYEPSAYLAYWCVRGLQSEYLSKLLPDTTVEHCSARVQQLTLWAENELYRQITFASAGDIASFDAFQLAYALRIYADTRIRHKTQLNRKVVSRALDMLASHQISDGLWPKAHPIFHFTTRGSVYPFSYEMLDVVIHESIPTELFVSQMDMLEASLSWAEQNRIETPTTRGWRSNHLAYKAEPEAWSTAAVLTTVRKIRAIIAHQINELILSRFKAQRFIRPDETPLSDDRFYDCELPLSEEPSLKAAVRKYLIQSHQHDDMIEDRRYSAVFFGPPGTAKTSLAEAVARGLGWPYIYLQTSDFAGEGANQVIGKARDVFDQLSLLDKAVVLIDEVEEFVRDREKETEAGSRMITTSMLSFIQELRRQKSVIFIVATNFLDKFDAAITRVGGRFDMMILVSPPTKAEKKRIFCEHLKKIEKLKRHYDKLCRQFDNFVDSNYEVIQYFAFSEWRAFVSDVINECLEKGLDSFKEKSLEERLRQQSASIALKDPNDVARYKDSKELVRVS